MRSASRLRAWPKVVVGGTTQADELARPAAADSNPTYRKSTTSRFWAGFGAFLRGHLLQHMLAQRQVGDKLLQAFVLALQFLQAAQLRPCPRTCAATGSRSHTICDLLADAEFAADLGHGLPGLSLAQGVADLFVGKGLLFHGSLVGVWGPQSSKF